jgi:hypothetical protein
MNEINIPEFGSLSKIPSSKKGCEPKWVWEIGGQPVTFTTAQLCSYWSVFRVCLLYNMKTTGALRLSWSAGKVAKEQWHVFVNKALSVMRERIDGA